MFCDDTSLSFLKYFSNFPKPNIFKSTFIPSIFNSWRASITQSIFFLETNLLLTPIVSLSFFLYSLLNSLDSTPAPIRTTSVSVMSSNFLAVKKLTVKIFSNALKLLLITFFMSGIELIILNSAPCMIIYCLQSIFAN